LARAESDGELTHGATMESFPAARCGTDVFEKLGNWVFFWSGTMELWNYDEGHVLFLVNRHAAERLCAAGLNPVYRRP
jgi:hypothetical protein